MTKRVIDLRGAAEPLLDIWSYGRRGPAITPAMREYIARTVGHVPEVMVKVSGGGRDVGGVKAHLRYIGRHGRLALEMDDGEQAQTPNEVNALLQDWGLDIEEKEGRRRYSGKSGPKSPRVARNIVFSMPAGTVAKKVFAAVRNFALEEWGLEHRYAMVLHTDTPRPHVHVVVKTVSEQGKRLDITQEVLQRWRQEFARHLRAQGVAANATPRTVRGISQSSKKDGIYRAGLRGESTWMRERTESVAQQLSSGKFKPPAGRAKLVNTRRAAVSRFQEISNQLETDGQRDLASRARQFVRDWPPPVTDQEAIGAAILHQVNQSRHEDRSPVR